MIECILLLNRLRRALGIRVLEIVIVAGLTASLSFLAVTSCCLLSSERAAEAVLETNLRALRGAIDFYHREHDRYPSSLDDLVAAGYLRSIPVDPMTQSSETWKLIFDGSSRERVIIDVSSSALGTSLDGTSFSEW